MNGKEILIEELKKVDWKEFAEPRPVFSEAEYQMFKNAGLSQDEIKTLENAEMTKQIIDLLPKADNEEENNKLLAALKAVSSNNDKENLSNLLLIAQKDPQRLIQLFALAELLED